MKSKRGFTIGSEFLAWGLIAAAVLIFLFIGYFIFTGKANSAIDYINNLLGFGR